MTMKMLSAGIIALSILAIMPPAASAEDTSAPAQDNPPDRVAELNYFSGNVTMEPAGTSSWSYVQLNRPLTTGDQLWSDNGGRAELYVGSTALRINQDTALDIVDLGDTTIQLKVTQGTLSTEVRALPPNQQIEIDTPNVALQVTRAGLFRVDVAADGNSTTITLRSGSATLYGDHGSLQMSAGQQISLTGTNLQQQWGAAAPVPDAFDQWVAMRDSAEDNSISARYVSREIPGYEGLDANGTWTNNPSYGPVWVPTVALSADWAPYREGHWAWIAPWGWTWIDDAPWGFAPFHYGRWAYLEGAWGWVPGPMMMAEPPIYAPALVAFVGGGDDSFRWGVNLSIGGFMGAGVAWFPLGPGEMWQPAYAYSPGYYNRVNNMNITNIHNTNIHNTTINNINNITNINPIHNIHNTYINQHVPGAVTAVPANTFVRGQSVARAALPFTPRQMAHARVGAGSPSIAPVNASFTGGMRPARAGQPALLAQRQVIATRAPVLPAAYHDTLAQHFANQGGRVAGAGKPVIHTTAPAMFATNRQPASPAAPAAQQDFHVINNAQARPMASRTSQPAGARNIRPAESNFNTMHMPAAQQSRFTPPSANRQTYPNTARLNQGPHVPVAQQYRFTPQANNHQPYRSPASARTNNGPYVPADQQHHFSAPAANRDPYRNPTRINNAPYRPAEQQHYFVPPAVNRDPYRNSNIGRINQTRPESSRQPAHTEAHPKEHP